MQYRAAITSIEHSTTNPRRITTERTINNARIAAVVVVHPTAVVHDKHAVSHYRAAVVIVVHPTVVVHGKNTVSYYRTAVVIVVHSTAIISGECAVGHRRIAGAVIHSTSTVIRIRTVGIAGGNGEAIYGSIGVGPASGDNMVAVIAVVGKIRAVITIQVAAKDGLMGLDIPLVGVRLSISGVASTESHPADQLKRSFSVTAAGAIYAVLIRNISPLCNTNFIVRIGYRKGILQVLERHGPA
jgi:hypothetical protein